MPLLMISAVYNDTATHDVEFGIFVQNEEYYADIEA